MEFGVQFFPDVGPQEKSGAAYFSDALALAEEADGLGFTHVRIVEHYFHQPSEAGSQRTLCWRKADSNHRSQGERDGRSVLRAARPNCGEFARDSLLEGAGFEPSVPGCKRVIPFWRREAGKGHGDDTRRSRDGEYSNPAPSTGENLTRSIRAPKILPSRLRVASRGGRDAPQNGTPATDIRVEMAAGWPFAAAQATNWLRAA
jgi:hypothetical protein